jgi:hypothetical protein
MTLEEIQEESRKAIIIANNPEAKTYEEALEMELEKGCYFLKDDKVLYLVEYRDSKQNTLHAREPSKWILGSFWPMENLFKKHCKIIGKPLTLDRVLIAASNLEATYYPDSNGLKIGIFNHDKDEEKEFLAMWDLTKTTLELQTEETQRKIHKLLND